MPESPIRAPAASTAGAALLAGWLVALLVAVSEGPSWGWGSAATLGLFALAGVLAVAWVVVEQRMAEPLVDMTMLRLRAGLDDQPVGDADRLRHVRVVRAVPQFVETPT